MGYINVTWVSESPTARGESWSNTIMLASGSAPSQSNNPQLVTSSNYASYISSTSYEYIALGSYYKNFPGTPTNSTWVYWMGDNAGSSGILQGTGINYTLPFPPYASIDAVQVDPTGGQNWQAIAAFNSTTCPSGYIGMTGDGGSYNGEINFSGAILNGGPYFESGGASYSGSLARDIIDTSGGILRALATQNGFGVASQDLKDLDAQIIVPLYNIAGDGTGLMQTPAFNDVFNAIAMVAGNRRRVVWALPKAATQNAEYHGTAMDYNQFRNYVGQDQNLTVVYGDVNTGSNGTGIDDPAAAVAGRICALHPHETLTLKNINMSLASREDEQAQAAWKEGQIVCVFRRSDLGFSTDQINYGFTFAGTSPSNRLNNVRCKYIVLYNVLVDLWSLMSSDPAPGINKAGLRTIIDTINGTLDRLLSQGIVDPDTVSAQREVDIPLLRGSATEWRWANLNLKVPSIIVRWPWINSAETLEITQFGEVL